tara:strand:+ start:4836 stop:5756 length:921 start_codon:yes stop_codon:yes gene_type:complete
MVTQVVEVAEDGHHLSKYRGFMQVKRDGVEVGRVPLDDITALILSAHQITLSKTLIMELAERNAPVMTCGKNYHPQAFSLPYASHFDQVGVLWAQIDCSQPLAKRIWQAVVREKITNQKIILEHFAVPDQPVQELGLLIRRVKSGDPENMEAQAARLYWKYLLGDDFRRDRETGLENSLLNYGYSILRAAAARAVCGAGLTPALGIHHRNRKNPFALVDDFMEPFRPLVDMVVRQIMDDGGGDEDGLTPETKRQLARILDMDVQTAKGMSTVMNALHRVAQTFVSSLQEKDNRVEFPGLIPAGNLF